MSLCPLSSAATIASPFLCMFPPSLPTPFVWSRRRKSTFISESCFRWPANAAPVPLW
jgi:hypothetical protein